jgi:hypothetical protein
MFTILNNQTDHIEQRKPMIILWSEHIDNAGARNVRLARNIKLFKAVRYKPSAPAASIAVLFIYS